ncbi:hypothetical protein ACFUOZ_02380 [Paenarthrobacter sp. NPDC057355]|uniref:hypothetical protein n=1 Tax=Paenarthrobacter sp. NPDC057355 TaxID=3346105 RepID=UPI00363FD4F9
MEFQQTHFGATMDAAGVDSTAVHISLMVVVVIGAMATALFGLVAVLVLVPLAAVLLRRRKGKLLHPPFSSRRPVVPPPVTIHATATRNTHHEFVTPKSKQFI